jgi:hypothetical protein
MVGIDELFGWYETENNLPPFILYRSGNFNHSFLLNNNCIKKIRDDLNLQQALRK